MPRARLLVIDSDPGAPETINRLVGDGFDISAAPSGDLGLEAVRAAASAGVRYEIVLLDVHALGRGGAETLGKLAAADPQARIVLTADDGAGEAAAAVAHLGAYDAVGKPYHAAELRLRLERALGDRRAASSSNPPRRRPRKSDVIVGGSAWTKVLFERIAMVAPTDVTVLITGESGTGKELVARTIHDLSPRRHRPLVVVNCGAIPEALLEDELFGHVRGAFTDATKDREGLVAQSDGGTLFLDEIGELPLSLQVKLLRFLQSQEFRRVGDDRDLRVDARVLAATNRDLDQMVETGRFRQDLFYRVNVFPLDLPPLRERKDDIPLLAQHFLLKHREKVGKHVDGFLPEAMDRLVAHSWPGNVRELENKVHHALVLAIGEHIRPEDIQLAPAPPAARPVVDLSRPFRELKRSVIDGFEREYLCALLERHRGNLAAAARQAQLDRKNLWALVQRHRIDVDQYRK